MKNKKKSKKNTIKKNIRRGGHSSKNFLNKRQKEIENNMFLNNKNKILSFLEILKGYIPLDKYLDNKNKKNEKNNGILDKRGVMHRPRDVKQIINQLYQQFNLIDTLDDESTSSIFNHLNIFHLTESQINNLYKMFQNDNEGKENSFVIEKYEQALAKHSSKKNTEPNYIPQENVQLGGAGPVQNRFLPYLRNLSISEFMNVQRADHINMEDTNIDNLIENGDIFDIYLREKQNSKICRHEEYVKKNENTLRFLWFWSIISPNGYDQLNWQIQDRKYELLSIYYYRWGSLSTPSLAGGYSYDELFNLIPDKKIKSLILLAICMNWPDNMLPLLL